jgi:hypothetical protein
LEFVEKIAALPDDQFEAVHRLCKSSGFRKKEIEGALHLRTRRAAKRAGEADSRSVRIQKADRLAKIEQLVRETVADVLANGVVLAHKPEGAKMESLVEKCERSGRVQENLSELIKSYAREHGCSLSAAADRVIMRPQVTAAGAREPSQMMKLHRLEQELRRAEAEVGNISKLGRSAHGVKIDDLVDKFMESGEGQRFTRQQAYAHIITNTEQGRKLFNADQRERGIPAMNDDAVEKAMRARRISSGSSAAPDLPANPPGSERSVNEQNQRGELNTQRGDNRVVETAAELLQRLADEKMRRNPAMTRSAAVLAAASDKAFLEAHNAEVRKALMG